MTHPDATAPIVLRSGYEPGVIGRIGELHGRYYAVAWGSGAGFEMQVLRGLCDFVEAYDPRTHLLLTAHAGDTMIGSAAVQSCPTRGAAQLRLVIVDPAWHGRGAGRALLEAAPGLVPGARRRDLLSVDGRGPAGVARDVRAGRFPSRRAGRGRALHRAARQHPHGAGARGGTDCRSLGAQRAHRRDRGGAPRRQDGGDEREAASASDAGGRAPADPRTTRRRAAPTAGSRRRRPAAGRAQPDADAPERAAQHHADHAAAVGAERHAHADLAASAAPPSRR